jgi:hypothetical protein
MGCNCKKNVRQAPEVIMSTPQVIKVPQTPDEQHAQDMQTYINNLPQQVEEDKQEN